MSFFYAFFNLRSLLYLIAFYVENKRKCDRHGGGIAAGVSRGSFRIAPSATFVELHKPHLFRNHSGTRMERLFQSPFYRTCIRAFNAGNGDKAFEINAKIC